MGLFNRVSKAKKLNSAGPERPSQSRAARTLFCCLDGDKISLIEASIDGAKGLVHKELPAISSNSAALDKPRDTNARMVCLLPKRHYLVRTAVLPQTSYENVRAMVQLETQTEMPADYGELEIAYRKACDNGNGYSTFEVYVAKRKELETALSRLKDAGIIPDLILPSAVVWANVLHQSQSHWLASTVGANQVELAALSKSRMLLLRSLAMDDISPASGRISAGITEFVRSVLSETQCPGSELKVQLGSRAKPEPLNNSEGIEWQRVVSQSILSPTSNEHPTGVTAFLLSAAELYFQQTDESSTSYNLLPVEFQRSKDRGVVRRYSIRGAILLAVCIALVWLLCQVMAYRYQRIGRDVAKSVESIRIEGQSIGAKIQQINTAHQVMESRDLISRTLNALLIATPKGASYSVVDVSMDGTVRLQGQAESLSQCFLLPESLVQSGMFQDVNMRDAGQVTKGEGSIAEFRIECKLKKKG